MKRILFVLIATTLFSCGTQKEKVKVALDLKVGETYYQTFEMVGNMNQHMAGGQLGEERDLNIEMKSVVRYRFDVLERDENGFAMSISYDRMVMEMKDDMGMIPEINYDSDIEDTSELNKIFRSFIGEKFSVRLNNSGAIEEITGLSEMFERVMAKLPDMSEQNKMQALQQIQTQFGEDQVKQNMQYMVNFPVEGVAIDDSWTDTINMPQFKAGYNTTYTVKEITDSHIILDVKGKMDMNEMPNIPANIDSVKIVGDINYEQKVDRKTGWNEAMDGGMIIKMFMSGMGMEINSTMDFTIKGFSS